MPAAVVATVMTAAEGKCDARHAIIIGRIIWVGVIRPVIAPRVIAVVIAPPVALPYHHSVVPVMGRNDVTAAMMIAAVAPASLGLGNQHRQHR